MKQKFCPFNPRRKNEHFLMFYEEIKSHKNLRMKIWKPKSVEQIDFCSLERLNVANLAPYC